MAASSLDHRYLRRSLWLLGASLVLLLVVVTMLIVEGGRIIAADREQQQVNALLPALRQTLEKMLDAETGQRGFLLTGDRSYLQPYMGARKEIDSQLQATHAVMENYNPLYLAQVERLMELQRTKFAELAETIRLADAGKNKQAMAIVRAGAGRELMLEARALLDELIDEMRARRSEISVRSQQTLRRMQLFTALASLLMIGATGLAAWLMLRILHENDALALQLQRDATHDGLTGLPNRRLFDELVPKLLEQARRRASTIAALYFDLDGFKRVNDELGHAAGDQLLQLTATRALAVLRQSDVLARLGGDEFAVVVADASDRAGLATLAQRLLAALSAPLPEQFRDLPIGASVGIAIFPERANDVTGLLRAADEAMYQAKRDGKGCFRFAAETAECG